MIVCLWPTVEKNSHSQKQQIMIKAIHFSTREKNKTVYRHGPRSGKAEDILVAERRIN